MANNNDACTTRLLLLFTLFVLYGKYSKKRNCLFIWVYHVLNYFDIYHVIYKLVHVYDLRCPIGSSIVRHIKAR